MPTLASLQFRVHTILIPRALLGPDTVQNILKLRALHGQTERVDSRSQLSSEWMCQDCSPPEQVLFQLRISLTPIHNTLKL